jgi:predicted metalloprotease with PDZ domain
VTNPFRGSRKVLRKLLPTVVFLAIFFLSASRGAATVYYTVSLRNPERHLFHVTMTIPDVNGEVIVQLPAWNALYQIRDFSAHLQGVVASTEIVGHAANLAEAASASVALGFSKLDGERLSIERLDKQTWRVTHTGAIRISYDAYWDEAGPFAAQLNGEHAFINPAMILMYVPARRGEDTYFCVDHLPDNWKSTLGPVNRATIGGITDAIACGKAADYDAMADTPIEAGNFEEFTLASMQPEIRVVIHGDNWKKKRVEEELTRICKYELQLMDGAPFERYTFLLHIGKAASGSGGGMEHANSTAIAVPSDEYLEGVAAHEFFHLWNVKRIRPASLEPVDYTKEQYTRALWFAEGVTSTYGSYTLLRSGLWNRQQFYADLSEQITELETRPAEHWQSAEESSLDAWLEKYALYNRGEESVSYYTKGQILGVLLDLLIRGRTENRKSLDDVMRLMNVEFAKAGKTYRDSLDVRLSAEKVAGGPFEEFFARYVAGAEALPYREVLESAGLELRTVESKRATLGFFVERDASGIVLVRGVDADSPAAQAGLRTDDIILSWNGGETPRRLERWVAEQKSGSALHLRIRRDQKEFDLETRLGEIKDVRYEVNEMPHASDAARRIRDGWLHGSTSAAMAP